jgi:steroid delta-isomerase-like uncharacterized protein
MSGRPQTSMGLLELARAHIEAENQHDLNLTMSTISDSGADYVVHSTGDAFSSRDEIRNFYEETFTAFPDMRVEIQNLIQDVERRQVLLQYGFTGTFKKPYQGLAPTNRQCYYDGAILYEFDQAGKLTKEIDYFDKTAFLTSMGIIKDTNSTLGKALLIFPQSPIYFLRCVWLRLFGRKQR